MNYEIRYYPQIQSDKKRLDNAVWERLLRTIQAKLVNKPQYFGDPLRGTLRKFWKLRVGDYRVGYFVVDEKNEVHVVAIGHRKNIYERMKRRLT